MRENSSTNHTPATPEAGRRNKLRRTTDMIPVGNAHDDVQTRHESAYKKALTVLLTNENTVANQWVHRVEKQLSEMKDLSQKDAQDLHKTMENLKTYMASDLSPVELTELGMRKRLEELRKRNHALSELHYSCAGFPVPLTPP